jgi:[ribosomal protein S18]-alanine N-acetyltransferase
VVGYCGTMFSETDAHITNIAVDPRWQRHQIATRLMVVAIRRAVVLGSKNLTLEVRHTNESAQAMYRRFGLAPAGVRKRYYENTDDAIVMWAHDIDSDDYSDRLAALWNAVDGPTVLASDVTKDIAPVSDRSES